MYQDEINLKKAKAAAEQEYLARTSGGVCGQAMGVSRDSEKQIPLRESIQHRLHRADYEHDTLSRAAKILDSHPEFEDLLWLIRSGLV